MKFKQTMWDERPISIKAMYVISFAGMLVFGGFNLAIGVMFLSIYYMTLVVAYAGHLDDRIAKLEKEVETP